MKWPKEVLIAPARGTPLEGALMRSCDLNACRRRCEGSTLCLPQKELARLQNWFYQIDTGVAGDALLYPAPAAELMRPPEDPTTWMDVEYNKELARRIQVRGGTPLPFADLLPLRRRAAPAAVGPGSAGGIGGRHPLGRARPSLDFRRWRRS